MSADPTRITRDAVYVAKTLPAEKLVFIILATLVMFNAWVSYLDTRANTAVLVQVKESLIQQSVVLMEFIKGVEKDHKDAADAIRAHTDAIKKLEALLQRKSVSGLRSGGQDNLGGTP